MKNSILIKSISKLSKRKLSSFVDFAHSPYFNKNEKVCDFALIIYNAYPFEKESALSKSSLYKIFFPKSKKQNQQLKDLMSNLYKLLLKFLATEEILEREEETTLLSIAASSRNGMLENVERKSKVLESKLLSRKHSEKDYQLHQLYLILDQHNINHQKNRNSLYLSEAVNALDRFYLDKRIQLTADMMNRNNIIGPKYQIRSKQELYQLADSGPDLKSPFFRIYQQIISLINLKESELIYDQLIELINTYQSELTKEQLQETFSYARNYCTKQINSGKSNYVQKLFELYQNLLSNQLLLKDNQISQWSYMNIITLGLRLKNYSWTRDFIEEYRLLLPKNELENAYTYNLANYYYHQANYKEAQKLLLDIEFTNQFYKLNSRSMLLKIYAEEQEFELLESLGNSFKLFLMRNNSISNYQKKAHQNLIRFTLKAAKLQGIKNLISKYDLSLKLEALKNEVNSNNKLTNKAWLVNQLTKIA